jgi:hypothetical protein
MTEIIFKTLKSPSAVLDYTEDWAATLGSSSPADTIATSSWTASAGLTVDSDSNTTTTATVWASSGTANRYGELVNTIVTAGGRTYQRTIIVKIQER